MPTENEAAIAVIDEIHATRARLRKGTEHMTPEEHVEHVHRKVAPVMARHNLQYATLEELAQLRSRARIPSESEAEPMMAGAGAAVSHY
jgi:hypothetical protein